MVIRNNKVKLTISTDTFPSGPKYSGYGRKNPNIPFRCGINQHIYLHHHHILVNKIHSLALAFLPIVEAGKKYG